MGLFSRIRQLVTLTPEAVSAVLSAAGFEAAEIDRPGYHRVAGGFITYWVPVRHEDRVGVGWHSGCWAEAEVHEPGPALAGCAEALEATGFLIEFVADYPCGYLVVWTEGEF